MKRKILAITLFSSTLLINIQSYAQCHIDDWTALKALYESTDGDNWRINTNWEEVIGDTPTPGCNLQLLYGIDLDDQERVDELSLSSNQLAGNIPTELGNLSNLIYLGLHRNELTESIPAELGSLNNLTNLDLSFNQLSGSIPVQLGNLVKLTSMLLLGNQLSGSIPAELGNLDNLQGLYLFLNQLSGSIPAELGNLSSLKFLSLRNNQLSGNIPAELSNLSTLSEVDLSGNRLSGNIPPELGNLTNLGYFNLQSNKLTGSIPTEICSLTLRGLKLNDNNLEGCYPDCMSSFCTQLSFTGNSSISDGNNFVIEWEEFCTLGVEVCNRPNCHIDDWTALKAFYESTDGDNWINNTGWEEVTGTSPSANCNLGSLFGITIEQRRVGLIQILHNDLSGNIPAEIDKLSKLRVLWLENHQLSGSIPAELCSLPELSILNLSRNNLEGCYPDCMRSLCGSLDYFNNNHGISDGNNFEATWVDFCALGVVACTIDKCNIDDWMALKALYESTDGDNWENNTGWHEVTGNEPSANCSLDSLYGITLYEGRVRFLNLPGNQLNGNLPSELGNLSSLFSLNLTNNQLYGSIPFELGYLSSLHEMVLTGNQLSGSIPVELGNLSVLRDLNLSNNQLGGKIPAELENLGGLNFLHLNNNQLNGSIPAELCNIPLTILIINDNNLEGCYPDCMNSICTQLYYDFRSDQLISDGNNFNASWKDFCDFGDGVCINCVPPSVGTFDCAE